MREVLLAAANKNEVVRNINETIAEALPNSGGLSGILGWAIGIGAMIALGVIVYGGVLYISSGISPAKKAEGIEWVKAALMGLALLLGGYLLLRFINPALLTY
jgi:hypothetical protein